MRLPAILSTIDFLVSLDRHESKEAGAGVQAASAHERTLSGPSPRPEGARRVMGECKVVHRGLARTIRDGVEQTARHT